MDVALCYSPGIEGSLRKIVLVMVCGGLCWAQASFCLQCLTVRDKGIRMPIGLM